MHREVTEARTGERSAETTYGVTSLGPEAAAPKRLLELNRGHWHIEANHILDWSFDEDRSRIRIGPENTTLLRRFAIGPHQGPRARRRGDDAQAGTCGACSTS